MKSLFLLGILLLASCQTHHAPKQDLQRHSSHQSNASSTSSRYVPTPKDAAPHGPIPVKFQMIKPRAEPLSRYGNPARYRVDGRTYEVMTSAKGYRTRGLASWYGTKFHSLRTSSGESYDMYALTAAHKTLPLPTYVRVKNLDNGRSAIIKVNDRGPFHSDRILDLSYGAAVKLGIFPKGTALVEIEAVTLRGTPNANYYLQVAAFESQNFAAQFRQKLVKLTSIPVFIVQEKDHYLVRIGPLKDKNMTDKLKATFAHHGIKSAFSLLM